MCSPGPKVSFDACFIPQSMHVEETHCCQRHCAKFAPRWCMTLLFGCWRQALRSGQTPGLMEVQTAPQRSIISQDYRLRHRCLLLRHRREYHQRR